MCRSHVRPVGARPKIQLQTRPVPASVHHTTRRCRRRACSAVSAAVSAEGLHVAVGPQIGGVRGRCEAPTRRRESEEEVGYAACQKPLSVQAAP